MPPRAIFLDASGRLIIVATENICELGPHCSGYHLRRQRHALVAVIARVQAEAILSPDRWSFDVSASNAARHRPDAFFESNRGVQLRISLHRGRSNPELRMPGGYSA